LLATDWLLWWVAGVGEAAKDSWLTASRGHPLGGATSS